MCQHDSPCKRGQDCPLRRQVDHDRAPCGTAPGAAPVPPDLQARLARGPARPAAAVHGS